MLKEIYVSNKKCNVIYILVGSICTGKITKKAEMNKFKDRREREIDLYIFSLSKC